MSGQPAPLLLRAVVGLGNPGSRYVGTRHNLGFQVVDALAKRLELEFARTPVAHVAKGMTAARTPVLLVEPQTYMNRSGEVWPAIPTLAEAELDSTLVIYDDVDLPVGRLRARAKGSDGGHRGMRSIHAVLGTERIPRLRIGCGPVPDGRDAVDFVLGRPQADEAEALERSVERAVDGLLTWLDWGSFLDLMNELNRQPAVRPPSQQDSSAPSSDRPPSTEGSPDSVE